MTALPHLGCRGARRWTEAATVTAAVAVELGTAGIPLASVGLADHGWGPETEVPSTLVGGVVYARATVAYRRTAVYYVVTSSKPMPAREAVALDSHPAGIRREGHVFPHVVPARPCSHWHVDTLDGVRVLAATLDRAFGPRRPGVVTYDDVRDLLPTHVYADPAPHDAP